MSLLKMNYIWIEVPYVLKQRVDQPDLAQRLAVSRLTEESKVHGSIHSRYIMR